MKCAAYLCTLAALCLNATAQAEVTESNVSIQIKLQINQEPPVNGPNRIRSFRIITYKTSDVIARIAQAKSLPFTSKAKLIYHFNFSPANGETALYLIREGSEEYILAPDELDLLFPGHIAGEGLPFVSKGKFTTSNPRKGNLMERGYGRLQWRPNGTKMDLESHGPLVYKSREVASKQYPEESFNFFTVSFKGIGSFDFDPNTPEHLAGIAECTVKHSPPKLLKVM